MNLGLEIVVLVIYTLAAARITRLINADTILDPIRLAIVNTAAAAETARDEANSLGQPARFLAFDRRMRRWKTVRYFMQCPWCVGLWLSLASAILPVIIIGWPWWTFLFVALAASHLIGVFAFAADTEDITVENS